MIGCIAAGGKGTRLAPVTKFLNKHLVPVGGGKLMIDYPVQQMAALGFKELQIITGAEHAGQVSEYLQDGHYQGFDRIDYRIQPRPAGIADCIKRVKHLIQDRKEGLLLMLGDNYFQLVQDLSVVEKSAYKAFAWEYDVGSKEAARAFGQTVLNDFGEVVGLVEKPANPMHSRILTGMYYFPADVADVIDTLEPSQRGELEITSLLDIFAKQGRLGVVPVLGEWRDLGEWHSWHKFISERQF